MGESDMKKMATEILKSLDVKIEKKKKVSFLKKEKKKSFIAPKW